MRKSLFAATALAMILAGCDKTGGDLTEALSDPAEDAGTVIRKSLRSPDSYQYVSGKTLWRGKDHAGDPAYVVLVSYSAENGFGARLRGCTWVAYRRTGPNEVGWNSRAALLEADRELCEVRTPRIEEIITTTAKKMAELNFPKTNPFAPSPEASPTPSPEPSPEPAARLSHPAPPVAESTPYPQHEPPAPRASARDSQRIAPSYSDRELNASTEPTRYEARFTPQAATPRTNPGSWITSNDYPLSALSEGREGIVSFRALVAPDGYVRECSITSSSGSPDLDDMTCIIIRQRGRFIPAMDSQGNRATGSYSGRIRWTIPRD